MVSYPYYYHLPPLPLLVAPTTTTTTTYYHYLSCKKCGGAGCRMLCKCCEVCYFVDVLRADFGNPWALARSRDINLTNLFTLVRMG